MRAIGRRRYIPTPPAFLRAFTRAKQQATQFRKVLSRTLIKVKHEIGRSAALREQLRRNGIIFRLILRGSRFADNHFVSFVSETGDIALFFSRVARMREKDKKQTRKKKLRDEKEPRDNAVDILRCARGVPLRVYSSKGIRKKHIYTVCYSLPRTSEEGAFYLPVKGRHCVVGVRARGFKRKT